MNPLNRLARYIVIAGVLALSACVIGPDRGYVRDDPHRQANDYQRDDGDRHCNSDADHRGDACRDADHH